MPLEEGGRTLIQFPNASGLDRKVWRVRLRHFSAHTTLDIYEHRWPDKDESARQANLGFFANRTDPVRTEVATSCCLYYTPKYSSYSNGCGRWAAGVISFSRL